MYIKQTNPVAIRSQQMISDALLHLMEQQPFNTITQICKEADIGRKTFYRSFETKEDKESISESPPLLSERWTFLL